MLVCPNCSRFIDARDVHCAICTMEHLYYVDQGSYSFQEVCSKLDQKEWTGFTLVVDEKGTKVPLNRHRNFTRYFLTHSSTKQNRILDIPHPSIPANKPKQSRVKADRVVKNRKPTFRILALLMILFAALYIAKEKTHVFVSKERHPPSKLHDFIMQTRDADIGILGFPKEGDLKQEAMHLRDPFTQWNGDDLGEFLLTASLMDAQLPTDFPLWLTWAHEVYPQSSSVLAAKASWSFRYSLFPEACRLVADCTHKACHAMNAACQRSEKNAEPSSYLARYSLVYRLGNGDAPTISLLDHTPPEIAIAVQGDLALARGNIAQGLDFYKKAKEIGTDVSEELILTYSMLGEFEKVEEIWSRTKSSLNLSVHAQHVLVRVFIELKKFQKASEILEQIPDSSISQLQKHHLAFLQNINKEEPLSCLPENASEKLYCARVHLMYGNSEKSLSMIHDLTLGDPARAVIELLVAMRKADRIAMDDAIKSFAYGPSKILSHAHPKTAYIPSISLVEMERVLRGSITSEETKAISSWALLHNPKRLLGVDVVSAPVCSAMLLYALENKKYPLAEEKLQCLAFFDIHSHMMKFYKNYARAHERPDLYVHTQWKELLGQTSSRTLWYWSWVHEKTIHSFNQMHGVRSSHFSFGSRWYQLQDGYSD